MEILTNVNDIFALPVNTGEAVCITTNGKVRKDGRAVMGRGIAKEADDRFKVAVQLAEYLRAHGNRAFHLGIHTDAMTGREIRLLTFPTKHDWRDDSDLDLIRTSAEQLVRITDKFAIRTVYLPRPGCANGGLDWETQVRPVIEPILDDRFVIADQAAKTGEVSDVWSDSIEMLDPFAATVESLAAERENQKAIQRILDALHAEIEDCRRAAN